MPELPEVETVRRGLEKLIVGRRFEAVNFDWPKGFPNAASDVDTFLVGAAVKSVSRRGKVLIIDLDSDYSLVIHLKMTGQLVFVDTDTDRATSAERLFEETRKFKDSKFPAAESRVSSKSVLQRSASDPSSIKRFGGGHPTDSLVGKLPDKSTRVTLTFDDGARLFFNDQRKFGWMRLMPTPEVMNIDLLKSMGPEPLSADFTAEEFARRIQKHPKLTIKAALLNQEVVAGVGNIYADEALWGAVLHPRKRVKSISNAKLATLLEELRYVLRLAIDKRGSTDRNYVDADGKKGSYLKFARVFRREGQPCPRCSELIIKIRVAGRGTHICPREQKLR